MSSPATLVQRPSYRLGAAEAQESHELQNVRRPSHSNHDDHDFHTAEGKGVRAALHGDAVALASFWHRFTGRGRWVPWLTSWKNIVLSSPLNILWLLVPVAWVSHFYQEEWHHGATFTLCFLAIIPLEVMFDSIGEQMAMYLGKDLGDLLIVTLNNGVEATLAIILLLKCELRLLQSTIVGVVILHLLLVPGTAFLTGGARIMEQNLHAHPTQLNHSLLTVGVLAIVLPTAFFASLDRGSNSGAEGEGLGKYVTDEWRGKFLHMSHGLAILLLIIYIGSRIYLHNPPGEDNALQIGHNAPEELKHEEHHLAHATPKVNVWSCLIILAITIAVMATTAEFLVESIEEVRQGIEEEWFGLVLLPIVSFAADGTVATLFFLRYTFRVFFGKPSPPASLARGRAIDLSVQFTLFWHPFLVLLGWWSGRPMHMLFDYFEVALLLGACFLVNYVTADNKTNWVEGLVMVCFYVMIATVAWWYPGQEAAEAMLACKEPVAKFIAQLEGGEGGHEGGESTGEGSSSVAEHAARMVATAVVGEVRRRYVG